MPANDAGTPPGQGGEVAGGPAALPVYPVEAIPNDPTTVPIRPAATVMLVRPVSHDGSGVEVFMLKRSWNSDFVAGAYVFPGGGVDDEDGGLSSVCWGPSDVQASTLLGLERGGLAWWVAAVRECFEEAGVLLAYEREPDGTRGRVVGLHDPARTGRLVAHREALNTGKRDLGAICEQEGLLLAADQIHYFSHWITPLGSPRRYDTRFFVAHAPPGQEPIADQVETVAQLWTTPAEALARQARGELMMIQPTLANLSDLGRFGTVEALMADAAQRHELHAVLERSTHRSGNVRIAVPGDAYNQTDFIVPPDAQGRTGSKGGVNR